jgi:transcriptional regulator
MYIPPKFAIEDAAWAHRLMADHPFAQLITVGDDGAPFATHLPVLHDAGTGTLRAHLSRGNPQWRHLERGSEVLTVFWGPHAYVSPAWYETAPTVPTWNYATVHAYGTARLLDDPQTIRQHLRAMVERFEAGQPAPWRMDLPADFEASMLKGIVAFEIAISRLEAKGKLSQNRPAGDRRQVVAALRAAGTEDQAMVASLMEECELDKK